MTDNADEVERTETDEVNSSFDEAEEEEEWSEFEIAELQFLADDTEQKECQHHMGIDMREPSMAQNAGVEVLEIRQKDRHICLRVALLMFLQNKHRCIQAEWNKKVVQYKLHGSIAIWGYILPILPEVENETTDGSQLNVFASLLVEFIKGQDRIQEKIAILKKITHGTFVRVEETEGEACLKNIAKTLGREAQNAKSTAPFSK